MTKSGRFFESSPICPLTALDGRLSAENPPQPVHRLLDIGTVPKGAESNESLARRTEADPRCGNHVRVVQDVLEGLP